MKLLMTIGLVLALSLFAFSCGVVHPDLTATTSQPLQSIEERGAVVYPDGKGLYQIENVIYDKHLWIVIQRWLAAGGISITHHPECPTCKPK